MSATIYGSVFVPKQCNIVSYLQHRMRMEYFKEYKFFIFSYMNILTAILLYVYIILHCVQAFSHDDDVNLPQRWAIAAIAYVLYTLKGIKFLLILRYIIYSITYCFQLLLISLLPYPHSLELNVHSSMAKGHMFTRLAYRPHISSCLIWVDSFYVCTASNSSLQFFSYKQDIKG